MDNTRPNINLCRDKFKMLILLFCNTRFNAFALNKIPSSVFDSRLNSNQFRRNESISANTKCVFFIYPEVNTLDIYIYMLFYSTFRYRGKEIYKLASLMENMGILKSLNICIANLYRVARRINFAELK